MSRPRILLADDHTLVLEAFTSLLEPEYEVVGTVLDGRELLALAPKLQPDVIVLDIFMPNLNGSCGPLWWPAVRSSRATRCRWSTSGRLWFA